MCDTSNMYLFDMTNSCDFSGTFHARVCGAYVCVWHVSYTRAWHVSHIRVWHDLWVTCLICTCVTWLIHLTPLRRRTYIYVVCIYLCDIQMCVTCLVYTCVKLLNHATPLRRLIYIYVVCIYLCDMPHLCETTPSRRHIYICVVCIYLCDIYMCVTCLIYTCVTWLNYVTLRDVSHIYMWFVFIRVTCLYTFVWNDSFMSHIRHYASRICVSTCLPSRDIRHYDTYVVWYHTYACHIYVMYHVYAYLCVYHLEIYVIIYTYVIMYHVYACHIYAIVYHMRIHVFTI